MRGAHNKIGEAAAQTVDASDRKPPQSARHGRKDPEIALGRNNHLFAGSGGGARTWAAIVSVIQSAKLNDVEPNAYFHDTHSAALLIPKRHESSSWRFGISVDHRPRLSNIVPSQPDQSPAAFGLRARASRWAM